jgi:hypothetical protein
MKLALLGTDPDVLRLAAAARDAGHEIRWVGDVRPEDAEAMKFLAPGLAERPPEWELLLDHDIAEAVLVGRGSADTELRAEQLKRLAAEAIPLLVVHPIFDSVLPYYEVDMIRRETGGIVRHFNPMAGHPFVSDLAEWVRDGHRSTGAIHQLSCERQLHEPTRASVLAHLARDVELVAAVAGIIRRVTAVGPSTPAGSYGSFQVQMSTSGPASLRWSVRSAGRAARGFDMTLIGERGAATLSVRDGDAANEPAVWALAETFGDEDVRRPLEEFDPPNAAIAGLSAAIAEPNAERRAALSTWETATRAMEVVDAVELSLDKGKTIDVFQQQLTERLAFRGTMAALGCGLLVVGFLAIVLVTLLGGAEGALGRRLLPAWPLALLAVLALFLALQVIPLLVYKRTRSATLKPRRSENDDDGETAV